MQIKYLTLVLLTGFASVAAAQSAPIQNCVNLAPGFEPLSAEHLKAAGESGEPTPLCSDKAVKARQTPPSRKDIPAIAKAANGAIVTVVMANNDKPFAQGTGFLVSADGVIVTNYHVIETGNVAVVKFPDGTVLPVDGVLAADKVRDLAVIKVHGKRFQTLNLGDSDKIQVGENVVAIGGSLGLELTVSNGIVSGKRTDEKLGGKFIQITAPISHGNSGGPLFNMFGEVIGINSMFLEGGENLNFAIPVNDAKNLLRNQYAELRGLPNEVEKEAPKENSKVSPAPPSDGQGLDLPAYREYQELLKANDLTVSNGIYVCFSDNQKKNTQFSVISVTLMDKHSMTAIVNDFTDGVMSDSPSIFIGHIKPFSDEGGVIAELPSATTNGVEHSHDSDVFMWSFGDMTVERGFGKLIPGQVRMAYRFKFQHSTGRFIEDTVFNTGVEPAGFTIHDTGKCIRILNIAKTPEEQYKYAAEKMSITPTTSSNSLPPNTKMAAISPDGPVTSEHYWEDAIYCYHNPANNLRASDGETASCSELNLLREAREKTCKSKGPKEHPENCKGFLKSVKDLKAGRL
jgi:S1-C subfamily serine protease